MTTEEEITLRCMMRCLCCIVPSDANWPTDIFEDSLSVIQNTQDPEADLFIAFNQTWFRMSLEGGVGSRRPGIDCRCDARIL